MEKKTKRKKFLYSPILIVLALFMFAFYLKSSEKGKTKSDDTKDNNSSVITQNKTATIFPTDSPAEEPKPSPKPVAIPTNWITYKDELINIQISYPAEFIRKVEENGDLFISNENITLSFLPDFDGSPCANAPCNNYKDVKLNISGKLIDERIIWPDHEGNITFKTLAPYPHPKIYRTSVSIFGKFKSEKDLAVINKILETFRFIEY